MATYACSMCNYEYYEEIGDPQKHIDPNTKFEDLPEDFVCPICGATKEDFICIKK